MCNINKTKNVFSNVEIPYTAVTFRFLGFQGFSLLHLAAKYGHANLAKTLIEKGANINATAVSLISTWRLVFVSLFATLSWYPDHIIKRAQH